MQVSQFRIYDLVHIDGQGLFGGKIEISKPNETQKTIDKASLHVKVSLPASANYAEVEQALLDCARGYIAELAQFLECKTPTGLYQHQRLYVQSWSYEDIEGRGS